MNKKNLKKNLKRVIGFENITIVVFVIINIIFASLIVVSLLPETNIENNRSSNNGDVIGGIIIEEEDRPTMAPGSHYTTIDEGATPNISDYLYERPWYWYKDRFSMENITLDPSERIINATIHIYGYKLEYSSWLSIYTNHWNLTEQFLWHPNYYSWYNITWKNISLNQFEWNNIEVILKSSGCAMRRIASMYWSLTVNNTVGTIRTITDLVVDGDVSKQWFVVHG